MEELKGFRVGDKVKTRRGNELKEFTVVAINGDRVIISNGKVDFSRNPLDLIKVQD